MDWIILGACGLALVLSILAMMAANAATSDALGAWHRIRRLERETDKRATVAYADTIAERARLALEKAEGAHLRLNKAGADWADTGNGPAAPAKRPRKPSRKAAKKGAGR